MLEGRKVSGGKIRQARLRAGLSQAQLARTIGVSERNVVRWENGHHQPRLERAIRIAEACNVHVFDLLDGDDDESEPLSREARIHAAMRPLAAELARSDS